MTGKRVDAYLLQPEDEVRLLTIQQKHDATGNSDPALRHVAYWEDMQWLLDRVRRQEAGLKALKDEVDRLNEKLRSSWTPAT